MKKIKLLCWLVVVVLFASALAGCGTKQVQDDDDDVVTLRFLACWTSDSAIAPENFLDNPVINKLKEETGVLLNLEFATTTNLEKLNTVFASGDMPDIISTPYWGLTDSYTLLVKKAASQGLLLPIDDLVEKYGPNVKPALTEGVTKDFVEFDLNPPEFEGKQYIIPAENPRSEADIINPGRTLYMRGDIYDALNVNPDDINTSEDVYELLKKVKEGGFKDITGKNVIPVSTFGGGYLAGLLCTSFDRQQMSFSGYTKVDGKIVDEQFNPLYTDRLLFLRKLISEGLFDVEAFSQNESRAQEKMVRGSMAIIPGEYSIIQNQMESTLYVTNPEMRYVPLPFLEDADGERGRYLLDGNTGCPILIIPSTCKNPEAAMKFINYLASDEGKLLIGYGLEGVHYDMVDDKPKFKDEWVEKYRQNPRLLYNEGIRGVYDRFSLFSDRYSRYGETDIGIGEITDPIFKQAQELSPFLGMKDGIRITCYEHSYPDIEKIRAVKNNTRNNEIFMGACFAATPEEALKDLEDYRAEIRNAGIDDLFNYLEEQAQGRDDILY